MIVQVLKFCIVQFLKFIISPKSTKKTFSKKVSHIGYIQNFEKLHQDLGKWTTI